MSKVSCCSRGYQRCFFILTFPYPIPILVSSFCSNEEQKSINGLINCEFTFPQKSSGSSEKYAFSIKIQWENYLNNFLVFLFTQFVRILFSFSRFAGGKFSLRFALTTFKVIVKENIELNACSYRISPSSPILSECKWMWSAIVM